jgi:hypothetical protein
MSIYQIGSKDPHYDAEALNEVEQMTGGESLVFQNADHSLEVDNVQESLELMQRYVSRL